MNDASRTQKRALTRPGPGWTRLYGAVWEHASGARIHTLGLVRLANMTHVSLDNWEEGELGRRLVRANGGNRKRGLMAWAVRLTGAHNS